MQSTKGQLKHYTQWFKEWNKLSMLIVAGPCSAESYEQLEECVKVMLNTTPWHVLRLGIWKPRSRPGGFEGNIEALTWIKKLKSQYTFKCAVEVATPEHAALALEAKVDMLWVGARTVGLPFVVDELASALAQSPEVPLLVKNPLSPDVGLWAGAVERFLLKGLTRIGIVHRGFSWPYAHELRNWPMWSTVAQMKLHFPQISVFCDPSHIAGMATLVAPIVNDALNFGCDGLMIETHPNPQAALTDAKQQIPLREMPALLQNLKKPDVIKEETTIQYWRMHMDEIDQQLMHLLKKRDEVTNKIAQTKKDQQLQVVDYQRFQAMLELRKQWFDASDVDQSYIEQFFNLLHERSIQRQLSIVSKSDSH